MAAKHSAGFGKGTACGDGALRTTLPCAAPPSSPTLQNIETLRHQWELQQQELIDREVEDAVEQAKLQFNQSRDMAEIKTQRLLQEERDAMQRSVPRPCPWPCPETRRHPSVATAVAVVQDRAGGGRRMVVLGPADGQWTVGRARNRAFAEAQPPCL